VKHHLRADTLFLFLLAALLVVTLAATGMQIPDAPARAMPPLRPTATPTPTATLGWWDAVSFATPGLPALPGLPAVSLEGSASGSGGGTVPFQVTACPGPHARVTLITRQGVWWLIEGTASVDPFWYWKMELSTDGSHWTTLYRSESPVAAGRLMEFNTTTVPRGAYRLRLTVVKQDGNYPEPCEVGISL
jgi:hypothetical protein